MRLLMVNWARMPDGPSRGGGANGYLKELAIELARRGHDVACVNSGMAYLPKSWIGATPDESLVPGACEIRRMRDFVVPPAPGAPESGGGVHGHAPRIRIFEAINSPVVAPAYFQFRSPRAEMGCPDIEREFVGLLRHLRPDVVHFHNIEGFSPLCVDACHIGAGDWPGARVVFSLHNYQTICPQVYLMQHGQDPCFDYENGHACARCIDPPLRDAEIRARLEGFWRERPELVELAQAIVNAPKQSAWSRLVHGKRTPPSGPPMPGVPLNAADASDAEPAARTSAPIAAHTASDASRRSPVVPATPIVSLTREGAPFIPLDNTIHPEPRATLPPNDYALRRHALVDMLNRCDRVLAVSSFVERKFASMGVKPERLRTIHIGSRMPEFVPAAPRSAPAPRVPGAPLRLAFVGYHNFYKGLHVLIAALEILPPAALARIDLAIHAKDIASSSPQLHAIRPTLAALSISADYTLSELPSLLSDRDIGVVPSVWWDNAPQTVLEFLACGLPVLGANVGGIPDFIQDDVNGLLFRANDPPDLARALTRLLDDASLLTRLRTGVAPPKSMRDHAAEIEREYQSL